MKTEKNILIAFILNLSFSILEFIGGAITGSVAIASDAVHDMGDAMSIGISYFLERKSKKKPDETYTYGYTRYSVIGGMITTIILLFGSVAVICNAITRIMNPIEVNYSGMIVLAVIGVIVNFCATWFTKDGDSLNQRAVNLHMLEDVLGWIVVLIGAIVMNFTDITIIDPLMSLGVALFILVNSIKNMKEIIDLFMEKIPDNININELKAHLCKIEGIKDVHHIHIRSLDGHNNCATMHIVTNEDNYKIKKTVREKLREYGIMHTTLELEYVGELCPDKYCHIEKHHSHSGCHHHH